VMSALLTHRLQMPFLFNAIEGQPEQNAICNKCANNSANMEAIGIDPSGETSPDATLWKLAGWSTRSSSTM